MRDTINAIYRTSLKRARASIAALLIAGSALAADLPSDLTGTYVGSESLVGWQCEIRAFEIYGVGSSRYLSADCQTPSGRVSGGESTNATCPTTEGTRPPLVPWSCQSGICFTPSTPRMSVLSYSPATAQCALGQIVVTVGTGPATVMCRTQIIVPTYPYQGCGAVAPEPLPQPPPAPRYPRLCRQFGFYCGR